jgi:hypothetical protein
MPLSAKGASCMPSRSAAPPQMIEELVSRCAMRKTPMGTMPVSEWRRRSRKWFFLDEARHGVGLRRCDRLKTAITRISLGIRQLGKCRFVPPPGAMTPPEGPIGPAPMPPPARRGPARGGHGHALNAAFLHGLGDLAGDLDELHAQLADGAGQERGFLGGQVALGLFFEHAQHVDVDLGEVERDHRPPGSGVGERAHRGKGLGNQEAEQVLEADRLAGLAATFSRFACGGGCRGEAWRACWRRPAFPSPPVLAPSSRCR